MVALAKTHASPSSQTIFLCKTKGRNSSIWDQHMPPLLTNHFPPQNQGQQLQLCGKRRPPLRKPFFFAKPWAVIVALGTTHAFPASKTIFFAKGSNSSFRDNTCLPLLTNHFPFDLQNQGQSFQLQENTFHPLYLTYFKIIGCNLSCTGPTGCLCTHHLWKVSPGTSKWLGHPPTQTESINIFTYPPRLLRERSINIRYNSNSKSCVEYGSSPPLQANSPSDRQLKFCLYYS